MRLRLAAALCLLSCAAHAGGSFDTGYGIWSPSGLWHRVTEPACVTPHTGTACVYYGIDGACNYANGQVQDASLTTLAPVVLTATNDFISFWLLYGVQSFDPACQDRLHLEYSVTGQSHWIDTGDVFNTQSDPVGGSLIEDWASVSGLGGPPLWQFEDRSLQAYVPTPANNLPNYYWSLRYVSSNSQLGDANCGPSDGLQDFLGYAVDDINIGVAPAPLALQKSVNPALGAPGSTFTFTLSATNTTAAPADVALWDTLPAGYAYAAASGGGSISAGLAQWSLTALGASQTASVQLMVQAAPGMADTDWVNTAAGSSSALATTTVLSAQVLAKIRAPVLTLTKSVQPSSLASGDVATYNLVVENDSPLTQTVTVSDPLPSAFAPNEVYPALSGTTYWNVGSMAPGQILSFNIWGPVYGQNSQTVVNTAAVSANGTVTATASASLSVNNPVRPNISIQAIYPNPAPSHNAGAPQEAFVAYNLSAAMPVTLDVYDVAGEKVRSLPVAGAEGLNQAGWDLKNASGLQVASGLYILRLSSALAVQPQAQASGTLAVLK